MSIQRDEQPRYGGYAAKSRPRRSATHTGALTDDLPTPHSNKDRRTRDRAKDMAVPITPRL
jgi:hypothetical protein